MTCAPFEDLKKDYPLENAKHEQQHAIDRKRGDFHQDWAPSLPKHRRTLIEGLNITRGKRKAHRISIRRIKNRKTKSRSARVSTKKMMHKFRIVMPNPSK